MEEGVERFYSPSSILPPPFSLPLLFMIVTQTSLEPKLTPEQTPFVIDAQLQRAGAKSTSYFGGYVAGTAWHAQNFVGDSVNWTTALFRTGSSISEDAGSILESTTLIALESNISETFLPGTPLADETEFSELLTPDLVTLRYYPKPKNNFDYLDSYQGETKFSRLERSQPRELIVEAKNILGNNGAQTIGAREAINYMFSRWASEFPWFTYKPVPDLRVPTPDASYNGDEGKLFVSLIAIVAKEKKSMREIIDEWLSIFPSTILRQDEDGDIVLIPRYGPNAPTALKQLEWRDLYELSEGKPDPKRVVNACTVSSSGYKIIENEGVMQRSWLSLRFGGRPGYNDFYDEGDLFELPSDRIDLRTGNYLGNFAGWKLGEDIILKDSSDIMLSSPDGANTIRHCVANMTAKRDNQGTPETITLGPLEAAFNNFIPLDGSEVLFFRLDKTVGTGLFGLDKRRFFVEIYVRYDAASRTVQFGRGSYQLKDQDMFANIELDLYGVGDAWKNDSANITASFGLDSTDFLPGVNGNALEASRNDYGRKEASLSSSVFALTVEQSEQIAQGYVLANIEPKTVRQAQQSVWNKFPVKFADIGKKIQLPNGEIALVENRNYADGFSLEGGSLSSSFTAVVTETLLQTTGFISLSDGSPLQLTDGTIVEIS